MRIRYTTDAEPYFEGDVIEVDTVVAEGLIERGVAEEVDADTDLYQANVARTGDGVSVYDKRRRGLEEGETPEARAERESGETPTKATRKGRKAKADDKKDGE